MLLVGSIAVVILASWLAYKYFCDTTQKRMLHFFRQRDCEAANEKHLVFKIVEESRMLATGIAFCVAVAVICGVLIGTLVEEKKHKEWSRQNCKEIRKGVLLCEIPLPELYGDQR